MGAQTPLTCSSRPVAVAVAVAAARSGFGKCSRRGGFIPPVRGPPPVAPGRTGARRSARGPPSGPRPALFQPRLGPTVLPIEVGVRRLSIGRGVSALRLRLRFGPGGSRGPGCRVNRAGSRRDPGMFSMVRRGNVLLDRIGRGAGPHGQDHAHDRGPGRDESQSHDAFSEERGETVPYVAYTSPPYEASESVCAKLGEL